MMVPREDKLVRIYCQLNGIKPGQDGRLDRSKVTPSVILNAAQKILHPCKHFRSSDIPLPAILRVRATSKKPVSLETRSTVRSTPERTMLTSKPINRQARIQALRLVDCIPGKWNIPSHIASRAVSENWLYDRSAKELAPISVLMTASFLQEMLSTPIPPRLGKA